jgi:hypothetical protein
VRRAPRFTLPGSLRGLLFALALPLAAGCGASEKKQTAAEWLRENTVILDQLGSYDHRTRQQGINRFLKLGKEQGTEVVNYLLADPSLEDYRIEVVLARILAEWKDSRAITYLMRNLRSRDQGAVEIAKEGLMIFGNEPRILAAVGELLGDPDPKSRAVAAEVLSEMKGHDALDLLGERLKVEENSEIRAACLAGILNSRDDRRTEFLVEALADRDPEIRAMAWGALVEKKPPVEFDPEADPASRQKAIARLKLWAGAQRAAAKNR